MTPEPGKIYSRRGFNFTVHHVGDGQVYLRRWRDWEPEDEDALIRVTLEVWRRQMADSMPMEGK